MKGKISLLTRKVFASVIAIAMSIPPTAFAKEAEPVVYDANSSIMGLAEKKENETRIENNGQTKLVKDLGDYSLELTSTLGENLTRIDYTIKINRKEKNDKDSEKNLSLTLTKTPGSNINDLRLVSANTDVQTNEPDFSKDLEGLQLISKAKDEIIYKLSADVAKAKDQRVYELILGLKEDDKEAKVFDYNLKAETGISLVDNKEVEIIKLVKNEEKTSKANGKYKKEGILDGIFASHDTISWTDYILNDGKENKEFTYNFDLDQNQETKSSKIALDYYELGGNGFEIKREFSQSIDFAKKIKFEIPAGFIAKINLQTKVSKKNTKIKNYSLNKSEVKNPIYIEGNEEENSEEDEEPAPADKNQEKKPSTEIKVDDKAAEEKKAEDKKENKGTTEPKDQTSDKKTSETEILIKDANGNEISVENKDDKNQSQENGGSKLSALQLNKDGLLSKIKSESNLTDNTKSAVEELTNKLDIYNTGKITHQEILDFIKSIAERYKIEKVDLRSYIDYILSGLNQEANPAARLDTDEIIRYAYPEKSSTPETPANDGSKDKKENNPQNPDKLGEKEENQTTGQTKDQDKNSTNSPNKEEKTDDKKTSEEIKDEKSKKSLMDKIKDGLENILGTKDEKSMTNYEKADKELKEALANAKDIYEIQDVLHQIEEKYKLSPEEEKMLMSENDAEIKSLVEKTRNGNSIFRMFRATDPLEGKKFNLKTIYNTSNSFGPIRVGQYFDVKLDPKLTVLNPTALPKIQNPRTGEVIAEPHYEPATNTIRYKVVKSISENLSIQLNIPVDYNIDYIRNKANISQDSGFEVENFVSGLGVTEPKSIGKFRVDKDGNIAGSIIEPGKENNYQFFENGADYRVEMQAKSSPIVENGKLTAIDWTVSFISSHDLSSDLIDLRTNFTIVDGSGLEKIEQVYLNGEPISTVDNNMGDKFLIRDSKHHKADKNSKEYNYTFRTPVAEPQSFYSLDISAMLKGSMIKEDKNRIGAARLISQGYPEESLITLTPNRASANNRTTIKGEFKTNKTMSWKITDEVSSGDDGKLPLETRDYSDNQSRDRRLDDIKTSYYGLDSEGKMEQKVASYLLRAIPDKGTVPSGSQKPGTIAVYKIDTRSAIEPKEPIYELGGVKISLYQDLKAKMIWEMRGLLDTPPDSNLKIQSGNENFNQTVTVPYKRNQDLYEKEFTLKGIKVFDINNGKPEKSDLIFSQTFNPDKKTIGNKDYTFAQRSVFYNDYTKTYEIQNSIKEFTNKKNGSFTIKKVDENGNPLPGAVFTLLSSGKEGQTTRSNITTGEDGRVTVSDVEPGTYRLVETKAPVGYKLSTENKTVTINDAGETNKQPTYPTAYRQHDGDGGHFMNAMDYAKVSDDKRSVDYYVFIKAKADANGKRTNKNTRFFANIRGAQTFNAEIYDVSPDKRDALRKAMEDQTADLAIKNLGLPKMTNNGVEAGNEITNTFGDDAYISNSPHNWGRGVIIKIPQARLNDSWGYLIKIPGNISSANINPRYAWFLDAYFVDDINKNWSLNRADLNIDINNTLKTEDVIEVVNKKFPSQDIIIQKEDRFENELLGAEFSLYTMDGKLLKTGKTDKDGVLNLGKWSPGEYELIETNPPENYYAPPLHYHVTIDDNGSIKYVGKDKDEQTVRPGNLFWIEQRLISDPETIKPEVKVTKANIFLVENGSGKRGNIWEGFEFETFTFEAGIEVRAAKTGQRLDIQLDRRWDLARLATDNIPEIKDKNTGEVVAKPYLNKQTNLITYVFNEKADGTTVNMDLEIKGLYPSPYEATTNDTTYIFKNSINPSGDLDPNSTNQRVDFDTKFTADYGDFLFRWVGNHKDPRYKSTSPAYSVALTDTKVNDNGTPTEARAVLYYNPYASSNQDATNVFNVDWVSVDNGLSASPTARTRYGRPMQLKKVRIYKVTRFDYTNDVYNGSHISLMPHSMGVDPSRDPNNYELVGDFDIDYKNQREVFLTQGAYGIQFKRDIQYKGTLIGSNVQQAPLKVSLPRPANREGYVIETYFDVTDVNLYQQYYRQISMEQVGGNKMTRFYTQKSGSSSGTSDQVEVEIPKYYQQILGVKNARYNTGKFELTKIDQIQRTPLEGVVFVLKKEDDGSQIVKVTDAYGKIYFDKLKPGKYILEETQPKQGYAAEFRRWSVEVDTAGNTIINQLSFGNANPIYDGKLVVENKKKDGDFKIFKKDENDKPLAGATFKITKIVKAGEQAFERTAISQKPDGQVKFEDIEVGEYYLVETKAPEGYQKLNKKWKLEVTRENGKLKAKIYEVKGQKSLDNNTGYGLLNGMKKVDVYSRATTDWKADDNRKTDYHGKSRTPYKLGARIVGIDKTKREFVTRFVINPEGENLTTNLSASIYRQRPSHENMTWYDGDGDLNQSTIRIYSLNNKVTGAVHQIDLNDTTATDVTNLFIGSKIKPKQDEPHRLKFSLLTSEQETKERQGKLSADEKNALNEKLKKITNKPLIVEVKTSYKEPYGEIGLGMDLEMENGIYWKFDYYEDARGVVEIKETDSKDILTYVGEDTLIVNNESKKTRLKIKKLSKESKNPVEGATFNLINKDKNTPDYDQTTKSDKNGDLAFDKLVEGTYTLTETEPAAGYEKQNTTWTLKVTKDPSQPDGFKMELTADKGEEPGPGPGPEPEKPDQTELNKIGITVDYDVLLDPTTDALQRIGVNVKNIDVTKTRLYLTDANGQNLDIEVADGTLADSNLGVSNLALKNAKGPLTLRITDPRLSKEFTYKIKFKDQPPNPPGPKKFTLEDRRHPVDPNDTLQGTGIFALNGKPTRTKAIDEDDTEIETYTDPDTGEIKIKPGVDVDGPITLTVEHGDLPNGSKQFVIEVTGHGYGTDDNKSDYISVTKVANNLLDPADRPQKTNYKISGKAGYRYELSLIDEDNDANKFSYSYNGAYSPNTYYVDTATGDVYVNPGSNVDGPITMTITSNFLKSGQASETYPIEIKGHGEGVDDNDSIPRIHIQKVHDFQLPVDGLTYDTGYYLREFEGKDYTMSYYDGDGNALRGRVDADGQINVRVDKLINGPIKIVLRSDDIKTGSQEVTVGLVPSTLEGPVDPYFEVPRDDSSNWTIGYGIKNRKKSDRVEIVDESGKAVNVGIAGNDNIYLVSPVSKLDGPLKMTVYSEGKPIASNIIINMEDQIEGEPDINTETYHIEKREQLSPVVANNNWPDYMRMSTKVLGGTESDTYLKGRIFLNPIYDVNKNGNGPNKRTSLRINKNGAENFNVIVYWVMGSNLTNKRKFMTDTSQTTNLTNGSFRLVRNGRTMFGGLGDPYVLRDEGDSYYIEFPIRNTSSGWMKDGHIVEIEATYPNTSADKTNAQTKHVDYDWGPAPGVDSSDHIRGKLGFEKVKDTTRSRSANYYSARAMQTRSAFMNNEPVQLMPTALVDQPRLEMAMLSAKESGLEDASGLASQNDVLENAKDTADDSRFTFELSSKTATIYNKQVGVELVINKKGYIGNPLPGAQFTIDRLDKYDPIKKQYIKDNPRVQIKPENPSSIPGVADNVFVTDDQGHISIKNLIPGKYELTEVNPPEGYRKPKNPWLIEVKEKNGKLVIEQTPPGKTKEAFVDELSAATIKPGGPTTTAAKILSYKLISIDPEKRSFVYRFFINPQGIKNDEEYSFDFKPAGTLNGQDRFIFADEAKSPTNPNGKEGIMLNYRSTYRVKNPSKYENRQINTINLKNSDIELINTARFRPFRYGFTQDLINIKNVGVNNGDAVGYIIDLEGSYTENALEKGDEKLQLDFWFGNIKKGRMGDGHKIGYEYENQAGTDGSDQYVVEPWAKEFWGYKATGKGSWKNTADGQKKIYHITTDLRELFQAQSSQSVGTNGLDVFNKDNTYNMAFTKYDANAHDNSGGKPVKRLEGAVFQLQKYELGEYKDMQGYALATAFNGFVGFNNLSPGDYQIIEIKPPKGIDPKTGKEIHYRKIEGPVIKFRLEHGQGKTVTIDGQEYTRKGKFTLQYRHPMYVANQEIISQNSGLNKPGDVTNPEAQIPDYVTHATQHFGKVLNTLAGQGKIELEKTGDDGKPLNGAKFRVTRVSALGNKDEQDKEIIVSEEKETKTVKIDSDGKIIPNYKYTEGDEKNLKPGQQIIHGFVRFDELPVGNYILEEIEAPKGYKKSHEIRKFTVGGKGFDPYYEVPQSTAENSDLSDYITYDDQKVYHINDLDHQLGDPNAKYDYVDPNNKESLVLVNKLSLNRTKLKNDNKTIKPGDYFTIKISDNLDLQGIDGRQPSGLNIIEDGVGTIAHAQYDRQTNTVKYIFTAFAESYELEKFFATVNAYINKDRVTQDGNQNFSVTLGSSTSKNGSVYVSYSIAEGTQVNDFTHYNRVTGYYWDGYEWVYGTYNQSTGVTEHDDMAIATKLAEYNPDTGDFTQYFYINRNENNIAHDLKFGFAPDRKVSDATFEYYKIEEKDKASKMPNSWGIDFASLGEPEMRDENITIPAVNGEPKPLARGGYQKDLPSIGSRASKIGYIIKVTGKVVDANREYFKPYGTLLRKYNDYGDYIFANAWNDARFNNNDIRAQVDFSIDMTNSKNKIEFIKIDQFAQNIEGAKFSLHTVERDTQGNVISSTIYQDSARDNTNDPSSLGKDGRMTSDKNGRIHIEGLPTGKYGIKEELLAGYETPAEWIAFFEVNEEGQIVNITTNADKDNLDDKGIPKPLGQGEKIDQINSYKLVNKKKFKIRYKKIDALTKGILKGGQFELLYRENEIDPTTNKEIPWENVKEKKDGAEVNVSRQADENGIIEFEITKPGYYAIKEAKAPKGYVKPFDKDGIVKTFALHDGKFYEKSMIEFLASRQDLIDFVTDGWSHKDTYNLTINTEHKNVTYKKKDTEAKAKLTIGGLKNSAKAEISLKKKASQNAETFKLTYSPTNGTIDLDLNEVVQKLQAQSQSLNKYVDISTDDAIKIEIKQEVYEEDQQIKVDLNLDGDKEANTFVIPHIKYGDNYTNRKLSGDKEIITIKDKETNITQNKDPIEIENRKVELPKAFSTKEWIGYTIAGLAVMLAGVFIYFKKKQAIEA